MRVIYLGSAGPLSYIPLRDLLATDADADADADVVAVGVATPSLTPVADQSIPVIAEHQESIESLGHNHGLPVIALSRDWPNQRGQLERFAPDVILVSCFPYMLPDDVLSIPVSGCFNLHPSLLPAYRGPAPLYWQFRDRVSAFGITLHRMSSQLDAGNIAAQVVTPMPDGVTMEEANVILAEAGSALIKKVLSDIQGGSLREREQQESEASYRGFPPADRK